MINNLTKEQRAKAKAILADAANPEIHRNDVLLRLTKLGHELGGTERIELVRDVEFALDRRGNAHTLVSGNTVS